MRNTERGLRWGWLGLICETIKLGPETINCYAQKKKLLNFFMATNLQFIPPLRQQAS